MRISNFAVAAALLAVTLPGAKAETPFDGPVFTPDPSKPVASVSKVQVNFPNGNYLTEFNTGSKDEVIISKGTQSKKCTDVSVSVHTGHSHSTRLPNPEPGHCRFLPEPSLTMDSKVR